MSGVLSCPEAVTGCNPRSKSLNGERQRIDGGRLVRSTEQPLQVLLGRLQGIITLHRSHHQR